VSRDEVMSDAELDAWLKKANDDLLAAHNQHIDVEAGLRDVLRRAAPPSDRPAPRRAERRARLLVRAYWRDAICVAVVLVALAWLVLMGLDVRIGWPQ
jgi:ferric-dicitrate binding protein FerR (iron transport regulator)